MLIFYFAACIYGCSIRVDRLRRSRLHNVASPQRGFVPELETAVSPCCHLISEVRVYVGTKTIVSEYIRESSNTSNFYWVPGSAYNVTQSIKVGRRLLFKHKGVTSFILAYRFFLKLLYGDKNMLILQQIIKLNLKYPSPELG